MALFERLRGGDAAADVPKTAAPHQRLREVHDRKVQTWHELKSRVHNGLFDYLDLSRITELRPDQVEKDVAQATRILLDQETVLLSLEERERLIKEIQHEVFGLGPLEPLLQDHTINDIFVNGHADIRVERFGKLEETVAQFKDNAHLMRIVEKIVSGVGRRIDETNPLVDARLKDGSRVNVIIPPLALDGPMVSIRRFAADPFTAEDLVELGTLTEGLVEVLSGVVKARLNVLVSGGTGAGKTTLLNVISGFIPEDERIVTIEDAAELQLKQGHVVRLETRPANLEGTGRIQARDLVINALRMRPDRIIVGEIRGSEALDMLQAMNTGHDGSIATVHANAPRDALTRVETMVAMTSLGIPLRAVREHIASAIDVVIQVSRLSDGRRRVVSVQEITGMEGEIVTMQEIFKFRRDGIDEHRNILGRLVATGIRPSFSEKLELCGIKLPPSIFEPQDE